MSIKGRGSLELQINQLLKIVLIYVYMKLFRKDVLALKH